MDQKEKSVVKFVKKNNILRTKKQLWTLDKIESIYNYPFIDLLLYAQKKHRENFPPNQIELASLLSIKTGGCPEDCSYCPQSAKFETNLKAKKMMSLNEVIDNAKIAKKAGAKRFCMGAAWRSPKDKDLKNVVQMVKEVKNLGLESCVTLGMLKKSQAICLKNAGLDYYNHNLDTSPDYYNNIISTRNYEDRLETLNIIREVGIKVCCGGIVGMGESRDQRVGLINQLANLDPYPESVPINNLVSVKGTPLELQEPIDPIEFVRTIAVTRITMPKAVVRLSAGRDQLGDAVQSLCFIAGANSIFYGEKLLVTDNSGISEDVKLLKKLGIKSKL